MKKLWTLLLGVIVASGLLPSTALAGGMGIPTIYSPSENQVLTNFPREAYLEWSYSPSADNYEIQISYSAYDDVSQWSNPTSYFTTNTYYNTPALVGDNQFRFRVRPIDYTNHGDVYGSWSAYRYFSYDTSSYAQWEAVEDNYDFVKNNSASLTMDVIQNDIYQNYSTLNVSILLTPLHGSAYVDANKMIVYTPDYNFIGYDDLQYQISNGTYASKAWAKINVKGGNSLTLAAKEDSVNFVRTSAAQTFYVDVLSNDIYSKKKDVILSVTLTPLHGSAFVKSDKKISYAPNAGYTGYDDFQYTITENGYTSAPAWVKINLSNSSTTPGGPTQPGTPPGGYEYEIPPTSAVNPFSDVSLTDPEGVAAVNLYNKAILGGYPDGTFRPNNFVNRAEIAKFIAKAIYSNKVKDYSNSDNPGLWDINENDWFYDYVIAMVKANIFSGYSDKSFKPGAYINAAELSKVLVKAFDMKPSKAIPYYISDINGTEWYADYAYTCIIFDIFPKREKKFNAGTYVTRGELAYAIDHLLQIGN